MLEGLFNLAIVIVNHEPQRHQTKPWFLGELGKPMPIIHLFSRFGLSGLVSCAVVGLVGAVLESAWLVLYVHNDLDGVRIS